jgi:putative sigma-54 modulation protein
MMNVHYTGKLGALTPAQQKKLESRYAKIGKILLLNKEAHVIIAHEKRVSRAEITVNYYDHQLVGTGEDADAYTALTGALDKLEKQLIRMRAKWRDTHRAGASRKTAPEMESPEAPEPDGPTVYRINSVNRQKPMSVEEALLRIGGNRNYLVYRDGETGNLSVLLRRVDGNFDLLET